VAILERLPALATTGVGSLPFTDPSEAARHAANAYDLPFCPQLPRLEGDMIAEWLGGDPRRCGWSPERDRELPRAWGALLAELEREPPAHGVVKLQVTGPVTLAVALERERDAPPSRRGTLGLAREVAAWIAATAAGHVRALAERGLDALLVVDEPALAPFGTTGAEVTWEPLRAIAPAWGLHVCCAVPWELIGRAEPDLISFDLGLGLDDRGAAVLRRLDAHVAWGVLPVDAAPDAGRAAALLHDAPVSPERSLLTAACGAGRVSASRERALARALRTLSLSR
jgi:hypothetical protein